MKNLPNITLSSGQAERINDLIWQLGMEVYDILKDGEGCDEDLYRIDIRDGLEQ